MKLDDDAVFAELLARCGLDGPGLADRLTEWRALMARALIGHRQEERRLTLSFRDVGGVREGLEELCAKEALCCGFARFSLELAGDRLDLIVQLPEKR